MQKRNEEEARESGVYDRPHDAERMNRALARANFENLKHDTDQLADLAKALQLEVSKSNYNRLSLSVIDKAGKIEKLAKKIKGNAKGI